MTGEMNCLTLSKERVDLWLVFIDEVHDEALMEQYKTLLTPQEREQQLRFYFTKDRHRYLVTRALVRDVLSRYAPISPREWRFVPSHYGRPLIKNDHDVAKQISFNVSHTEGLIMLGVVRNRALGVDTENLKRNTFLEVADRVFSPSEREALRCMPHHLQMQRFFELWTLKESYIKARGMGLSIPLDEFSFELDIDQRISIHFEQKFADSSLRWKFWQWHPSPDHLAAICLEVITNSLTKLTVRKIIPLLNEHILNYEMLRTSI